MNIEALYKIYRQYPSVQTDTRKLKKDDLFFALKGPNFNGNKFAKQALDSGAAYVIVDEKISFQDGRLFYTDDVLQTLQALAKFHRVKLAKDSEGRTIPFIAITGSNGKTTTKELVSRVLSSSFKTYTTEGNLNNHIGVPLTILKIKDDVEATVIEMGANHLGEIAGYCEYAMPTHGLITNCGKAHLEGFGGIENVKKGKGELFDYLRTHHGTAFVNSDDLSVEQLSSGLEKIISYGKEGKYLKGSVAQSDPFLEIIIDGDSPLTVKTNLVGAYNFSNVIAAFCIGRFLKVPDQKIKDAIENYEPSNSRSQLIKDGSNLIILDTYNANPGSMKAAIENFAAMKSDKKILLLGSMMELGNESRNEHAAIINLIDKYSWEEVVLVGKGFAEIENEYVNFENSLMAKDWLKNLQPDNAQILVKGSRSMQMEKVLE
ncbi:MAG: UDP-N-acetylmuramoyl-tripeptide--D-alanyl-D-alanine ligase [Ginsengibacter sp.]